MKLIALCSNIPAFWDNKILDENHCLQYFGASWMPLFAKLVEEAKIGKVVSGDIALKDLEEGKILAQDIYVIQELNARHGKKLLRLGARGVVLTGAESPLFSYYFYDHLKSIAKQFMYRNLFDGSYQLIDEEQNSNHNFQFHFPSYFLKDTVIPSAWSSRNFMVMIAANKGGYSPIPQSSLKDQLIWLVHRIYKVVSPSFQLAQSHELHSKRIEVIKYFGAHNRLKLFGSNWKEYFRFDRKERDNLRPIIETLNPSFVDDKIQTLSQYKFAVCFENIAFSGYLTEKIIHCFFAGVIPIYLGAQNITEYIPSDCFIDFRNFQSLKELDDYLSKMDEKQANVFIENGRNFLKSEEGKKYSYEYFAQNIFELVLKYDNN